MAITTSRNLLKTGPLWLAACIATAFAMFLAATPSDANAAQPTARAAQSSSLKKHRGQQRANKARRARARRMRARRARRAGHNASLSSNTALTRRKAKSTSSSAESGIVDAGFESGLLNWNTAGVGEVIPTVVNDTVRSGGSAGRIALSGTDHRSELILGGNGGGSTSGMIEFDEGDEYWYAFSFYIEKMTYGRPGAHNLIMQFKGDDDGSPAFGLQLWDYEGDDEEYEDNPRGLWSHGPAMDGDRFLAPVPEHTWHDVAIHFKASGSGDGFYEVYLNGQLVDSANGVSMIADGASYAYIKNGLYRNGDEIPGDSEIRLDAARLGPSQSSVAPS